MPLLKNLSYRKSLSLFEASLQPNLGRIGYARILLSLDVLVFLGSTAK